MSGEGVIKEGVEQLVWKKRVSSDEPDIKGKNQVAQKNHQMKAVQEKKQSTGLLVRDSTHSGTISWAARRL